MTGRKLFGTDGVRGLANSEPMAIETTHLSAKRFPALRRNLTKYASLYTALAVFFSRRP